MSENINDFHQTAAAFMNRIMNNDRIHELQQQDESKLDLGDLKSKYENDDVPDDKKDQHKENQTPPEPNQLKMSETQDHSNETLQNRMIEILNLGYSDQQQTQAPEPGNETMHLEAAQPNAEQTDQQHFNAVDNDLKSSSLSQNPENINDQSAPEPGHDGFTEEQVKIVVDCAPNVDQSEYQDFDPEVAAPSAPEPTFESVPEPASSSSEVTFSESKEALSSASVPEPASSSSEVTFSESKEALSSASVPEPASSSSEVTFSTSEEAIISSSAPEPALSSSEVIFSTSEEAIISSSAPEPNISSFVSESSQNGAPEPTLNGSESKFSSSEDREEEEDSFPSESIDLKLKSKSRKPKWMIPAQPGSDDILDKFGTIRQNIRSGNTSNLRDLWEKRGKA